MPHWNPVRTPCHGYITGRTNYSVEVEYWEDASPGLVREGTLDPGSVQAWTYTAPNGSSSTGQLDVGHVFTFDWVSEAGGPSGVENVRLQEYIPPAYRSNLDVVGAWSAAREWDEARRRQQEQDRRRQEDEIRRQQQARTNAAIAEVLRQENERRRAERAARHAASGGGSGHRRRRRR